MKVLLCLVAQSLGLTSVSARPAEHRAANPSSPPPPPSHKEARSGVIGGSRKPRAAPDQLSSHACLPVPHLAPLPLLHLLRRRRPRLRPTTVPGPHKPRLRPTLLLDQGRTEPKGALTLDARVRGPGTHLRRAPTTRRDSHGPPSTDDHTPTTQPCAIQLNTSHIPYQTPKKIYPRITACDLCCIITNKKKESDLTQASQRKTNGTPVFRVTE